MNYVDGALASGKAFDCGRILRPAIRDVKRKAGSYLAAFPDSPAFVAQRLLLTDVKIGKVVHVNEKAGR